MVPFVPPSLVPPSPTFDVCIIKHLSPKIDSMWPEAAKACTEAIPVETGNLRPVITIYQGDFGRGIMGNDVCPVRQLVRDVRVDLRQVSARNDVMTHAPHEHQVKLAPLDLLSD